MLHKRFEITYDSPMRISLTMIKIILNFLVTFISITKIIQVRYSLKDTEKHKDKKKKKSPVTSLPRENKCNVLLYVFPVCVCV